VSSFYGIWKRNGEKITVAEAEKMQKAFDWWGPDESSFVVRDSLMIGQATLWNTPESKYEHLPLEKESCILAMDARIDNREELAKELDLPGRPMDEIGDSEFILAAYRKWGEECADRLLGDFAFVIWDEKKQRLFCARDFIGVRPFYYFINNKYFIFGSDMESLVKCIDINMTIRNASVADYFVNRQLMDVKHTFFNEIVRLEGGCILIVNEDTNKIKRYWHPADIKKQLNLSGESNWIEALRVLLEKAVSVRLRSNYSVAAHLSGGLDSSPLSILTARYMKQKIPGYILPVYSWQPEPISDEQKRNFEWSQAIEVAKFEGMQLKFSHLTPQKIIEGIKHYNLLYDKGSSLWYEIDIRKELHSRNIRTMISGWGGDEFITNHGYPFYTQMLLSGKWIAFSRRLFERIRDRNMGIKATLKFLYVNVLIPMFPNSFYCHMPRIHCKEFEFDFFADSFWPYLEQAYQNKTHIFSRYTSSTVKSELIRAWENSHVQARLNTWSQESLEARMRYVYPLLDRRLVEFSFQIPIKYLIRNGYDRYLYRRSLEGVLPKNVIWGKHKSEPSRWEKLKENIQLIKCPPGRESSLYLNMPSSHLFKDEEQKLIFLYFIECMESLNFKLN